jgi:hypothetical protein
MNFNIILSSTLELRTSLFRRYVFQPEFYTHLLFPSKRATFLACLIFIKESLRFWMKIVLNSSGKKVTLHETFKNKKEELEETNPDM